MSRLIARFLVSLGTFFFGICLPHLSSPLTIPPIESRQSEISEIKLKRHGCFGPCPVYEVTLRSDGTAYYTGYEFVERVGSYHAREYQFNFDQISKWLDQSPFFQLNDEYGREWIDAEVVTTSAIRGSEQKSVTTFNAPEPAELWEIDAVIDGVVSRIEWEKN